MRRTEQTTSSSEPRGRSRRTGWDPGAMSESRSRWADIAGDDAGERYAARFAKLAESGADLHGEARVCAELLPPGARVLDAGCGTGRVAIRLAELGYDCVGVDLDESMLEVARRAAPELT